MGYVITSGSTTLHGDRLRLCAALGERYKSLEVSAWAMEWFGISTFGICAADVGEHEMRYVNRGETYADTVVREGDKFTVDTWGDWFEQAESEHEQETDTRRCAWCGSYSEDHEICDCCGHAIDG